MDNVLSNTKFKNKMEAIKFLRSKKILSENHTKWIITFSDGSSVDLVQIFNEFADLANDEISKLKKCKCGQNSLPYKAQIEIDKCKRCGNDR